MVSLLLSPVLSRKCRDVGMSHRNVRARERAHNKSFAKVSRVVSVGRYLDTDWMRRAGAQKGKEREGGRVAGALQKADIVEGGRSSTATGMSMTGL